MYRCWSWWKRILLIRRIPMKAYKMCASICRFIIRSNCCIYVTASRSMPVYKLLLDSHRVCILLILQSIQFISIWNFFYFKNMTIISFFHLLVCQYYLIQRETRKIQITGLRHFLTYLIMKRYLRFQSIEHSGNTYSLRCYAENYCCRSKHSPSFTNSNFHFIHDRKYALKKDSITIRK